MAAPPQADMQEMQIKYGGDDSIDANTYINSLLHFTNVVQEVNRELSTENKIEIKVKANKPGSFIVDLVIQSVGVAVIGKELFTNAKEKFEYAKKVVSTVSEVYKVAKHLIGNKPKTITNDKDSTITIENNNGEVKVFDFRGANIYLKNGSIQNAIAQEFETLEADKGVTDLTFVGKEDEKLLSIAREEFYSLSSSGSNQELLPNEKIFITDAVLNISSLDLDFKKKWDFYYLGNKISAKVADSVFGEKINKGERFGKGDKFEVKMEIKQEYHEDVNAYVNKSYTIVEVIKHIDRPVQGELPM